METSNKQTIELDASGKKLGRLASEIAILLQGKKRADYAPNKVGDVEVIVNNVNQLEISEAKKNTKTYDSYSGYPGGRKIQTMETVIARKGVAEVLIKAVRGMLPKNKLQKLRLQNLIIKEN